MNLKKLLILLCAACLCTAFAGCAPKREDCPDLSGNYTATLQYAYGGTAFTAAYTHTETEKVLTFLAPESLLGVTAKKDLADGSVILSAGEVSFRAEAADGFFTCTALLDLPKKSGGEGKYLLQDENGHATLLCESGLPCRIYGSVNGKEYDVTVTDFTPILPKGVPNRDRAEEHSGN